MTRIKVLSVSTALVLAFAGSAQADVNGSQVWNAWKSAAESMGQVLTPGSESKDGDTLTIHDLGIAMSMPDVSIAGNIPMLEFRARADGTVAITMSPSYTMNVSVTAEGGPPANAELEIAQQGLSMIASGEEGEVTYDFVAPEMNMSVASLNIAGKEIDGDLALALSDMNGRYLLSQGDMTNVTSRLNVGAMNLDAEVHEPGGEGVFTMNFGFADIASSSEGSMGILANLQNLAQMLASGFATDSELSYGAATYEVSLQDKRQSFAFSGQSDSGMAAVAMDANALRYKLGANGFSFTMSGSDIPLPEVSASFAELAFGLLMPISASDAPQDFAMNVTLGDFSVSDMIWSIADPGGALPHDPATFIVDLAGQANWLVDILDPEAASIMGSEMPGMIHALDINEFVVAVGGAEMTGNGGFTFDNADLATFDGLPAPTGAIDLRLVGGNGLLDTLVAMGLVPEDQAMGARMMMGLFARPGDGEDTLVSKIEVDGATGAVSANGQRLQ